MRLSAVAAAAETAAAQHTYAGGCPGDQDDFSSEFADLVFILDNVERARPGISWTVGRLVSVGVTLVTLFLCLGRRHDEDGKL